MRTALIATTRAFSSDFKSIYEQMAFLGERYDKIYLLHLYSSDRLEKFIQETSQIKIEKAFSLSNEFEEVSKKKKFVTWKEFYDDFNPEFLKDIHIDDIWFFGAPQSDGGKLKRGKFGLEKGFHNNAFMTFLSVSKLYFLNFALLKIARLKRAHYHELSYDPGEASVNELTMEELIPPAGFTVYHGYNVPELGMLKDTSYQYGLKKVGQTFPFNSKIYDVVFGYSYMNKDRKVDHEMIQKIISEIDPQLKSKFIWRSKPDEYDTLVPKDAYMSLLSESLYTFVIPAYWNNIFSCSRYMEAIFYDCLPLVFSHCSYRDFFESYDVDLDRISNTIINSTSVHQALSMSEKTRVETLHYLQEKILE